MAPAGLGKALAEVVEVELGRDMVSDEAWRECGMERERETERGVSSRACR